MSDHSRTLARVFGQRAAARVHFRKSPTARTRSGRGYVMSNCAKTFSTGHEDAPVTAEARKALMRERSGLRDGRVRSAHPGFHAAADRGGAPGLTLAQSASLVTVCRSANLPVGSPTAGAKLFEAEQRVLIKPPQMWGVDVRGLVAPQFQPFAPFTFQARSTSRSSAGGSGSAYGSATWTRSISLASAPLPKRIGVSGRRGGLRPFVHFLLDVLEELPGGDAILRPCPAPLSPCVT